MSSQHMAAPGSLRGPEQPPTGLSPPPTQNSIHSLRKEPISTLHSPLHSRGNHISLGEPEAALHSPAWPAATRHRCGRAGLQLLFSPQNKAPCKDWVFCDHNPILWSSGGVSSYSIKRKTENSTKMAPNSNNVYFCSHYRSDNNRQWPSNHTLWFKYGLVLIARWVA